MEIINILLWWTTDVVLYLTRWALSSWSTCASWSSPPNSLRRSRGRTPWWGSSALATCPTTPRWPATANRARVMRRCCATSATFAASWGAGCRGYMPGGTGQTRAFVFNWNWNHSSSPGNKSFQLFLCFDPANGVKRWTPMAAAEGVTTGVMDTATVPAGAVGA